MDIDLDFELLLCLYISSILIFLSVFLFVHVRCSGAEGRDGTSGSNRTSRTSWSSWTTGRQRSVNAIPKLVIQICSKYRSESIMLSDLSMTSIQARRLIQSG